jgi:hypothetical protein
MLARAQLMHRLGDRRKTSHLPALIDLVLARPLVSTNLIAMNSRSRPAPPKTSSPNWACAN